MTSALDPNSTAHLPLVGPRQMDILRLLWQHGPATVRELRDRLVTDPPLAYTTILTICVRLAEKGLVERQRAESSDEARSANAYIYTPRCSEADVAHSQPALCDTPPTPSVPIDNGTDRMAVEQVLAYLGALRDTDGQRASDSARIDRRPARARRVGRAAIVRGDPAQAQAAADQTAQAQSQGAHPRISRPDLPRVRPPGPAAIRITP